MDQERDRQLLPQFPLSTLGPRLSATRVLVFGGIALILAGMLLGEIFAIFISHVASADIRREWTATVLPGVAHGDASAVNAGYGRIQVLLERRGRIMDTHSHLTAYGFLALALALLQPMNKYGEPTRRALAVCLVAGGVMQCLPIFASYWLPAQAKVWAWALSGAGGLSVLVAVLGNCGGLWSAASPTASATNAKTGGAATRPMSSMSGRMLLRTGGFLILAGMVFGFYYAWVFVTRHEPGQLGLLRDAFNSAWSNDLSRATTSILAYRALQSRIAIVTAAHSHVIEMGIMAVLLGLVQDFIFLSEDWKRRWAMLFCVGGAVMPICTYCASVYGLVFAGLADAFGMMSVVALFAMLVGAIRHSGAEEARRPA